MFKSDKPSKSKSSTPSERTVPIPETVEKVKGYNTLTIYKMTASPFYYVRIYEDGKIIRRSTKQEHRKDAIKFAEEFFVELKTKKLNKQPLTQKSGFEVCAWGLLKENKIKVQRGELAVRKLYNDEARLEKDLLPFFRRYEVAEIDYKTINDYLQHLNNDKELRNLSGSTLKIHLSHIKTILKYAQRMGVIQYLPAFPTIKTVDKPRSWFSSAEYSKLHNTARTHIGERFDIKARNGKLIRTCVLTQELYDLILFMGNTFIRPTDLRVLKHKHISLVTEPELYLRLNHPPTKGHSSPVVSMPKAVEIYDDIVKRQKREGYGKPEDYVFQPEHPENRDYAMQQLHRQFDYLLKITGLKQDVVGEKRTLYSLRHTAIMFRLVNAQGLDLLSLARTARTSVEMIDRFYAKHLTAEMNVSIIQSQRVESKKNRDEEVKKRVRAKKKKAAKVDKDKTLSSKDEKRGRIE
jgi:ribosomal protein L31E